MKKSIILLFTCCLSIALMAQDMTGVRIYINPGHGGFDSDDRNMTIYPFASGDQNGFWESQSNLDKGLMLKALLDSAGATTQISRTQNRTQDDLPLSTIVRLANEFNSDFMLSIHSNAGVNNYVLQLYAGVDNNDTYTYPTATPHSSESQAISTIIAQNLHSNKITIWGANYTVRGDKTFARTAMGWSDGYGVLRGLTVPGVISEGCMHDYTPETYRLMNREYKWMEAWHFFKSFATYFNCGNIPTGNIAGSIRDGNNKIITPDFYKIKNSRDELLPIHNAHVTLLDGTDTIQTYTTDNLYNGFFLFKKVNPGTYTLAIKANNYYDYQDTVTVYANNISYKNINMNMVRSTPPVVVSHLPNPTTITDSVEVATDIVLNFNWDMNETTTSNAFHISPATPGTITFEDSRRTLRFTPNAPLEKATEYTITLDTTASHPDTTQLHTLAQNFVLKFRTKNRSKLSVVLNYLIENDTLIGIKPTFMLVFDKKLLTTNLNSSTLPQYLIVKDQQGNIIRPNTRPTINSISGAYGSLYFDLSANMLPNTNYTLKLAPEISDISGVTLTDTITIPFRTYHEIIGNLPIIDPCEQASFTFISSQSLATTSGAAIKNTAKKKYGQACNELMYKFNAPDAEAYYSFNNRTYSVNQHTKLGLHILGDFSMNEIWLECSIDGDIKWTKLSTMNFADWRYHEISFDTILPSNTFYTLTAIKVVRKTSLLSNSGSFFIDNIMLLQDQSSATENNTSTSLNIYPNPATDYLYLEGIEENKTCVITLFNANGAIIKNTKGQAIYVGDLTPGLYFVQIKDESQSVTKSFIKK